MNNWLTQALQAQRDAGAEEMLKRVKRVLKCEDCNGSGEYSTPSSYDPCSQCDGTGFSSNGSCNDILATLEIINPN